MKTLLLIDANSIIHRSFHALPPFTVSSEASAKGGKPVGTPTGALYGLASIMLKLWREEKPDYAAAAFDRPEPTFREEKYKEYKAQRPPAPDILISQLIEAHNIFPVFGIKTFEAPGHEADDIIATLAEKFAEERDLRVVILTGDKDTLQLVRGDKVVVRTFKKGVSDTMIYDERAVEEKFGLKPNQLIDYKALMGDPSDNIKGVPGVGPKTAAELIKKFGSVENLYRNLSGDPKLEKKLGPFRREAELSRELVILDRNAPVKVEKLEDLRVADKEEAQKEYFHSLGFETLVKRAEGAKEDGKNNPDKKSHAGSGLFGDL